MKLVLYDWIEFDCSEFTNQSSFQSNSDSYIDWVENTWLIMKAMNISIDTLNCLTQKMNSFERQQIQSLQYWVWICDLWTFYHLFWNNMKKNIWLRIFWIWISILMIPVICAIIENKKIHLWDTIYSDWWCPWWIVVWLSDEKIITSDLSWNIQCEYYLSAIDYDLKKKNLNHRQTATWYEYLIDRL